MATSSTPTIEQLLEQHQSKDLLRLLTAGSVDDGKSTLIGRLLYDTHGVFEDQLAAVERDSARYGTTGDVPDLALLTDGLQAEREQGITIDVAYRYFSTKRRKFIVADTPGHEQYTRNMATGASTADLAVLLVDARYGVLTQTRRHAFLASLLGIRHVVVAVNKMDLVDWAEPRFEAVRRDMTAFAARLDVPDLHFIPMSAITGEGLTKPAVSMPWYRGRTLLDLLETIHIASDRNLLDLRFPVQHVLRPNRDFRGYAGTIASGRIRPGDDVLVLPSRVRSRVKTVQTHDGPLDEAFPPMAVVVTLEDERDISRGDMLVRPGNVPSVVRSFDAMLVWMHETPLNPTGEYLIKHTARYVTATVPRVRYRVDVDTLGRQAPDASEPLRLNEIGRVEVHVARPLYLDPYDRNRTTGAFVLIDRVTNDTVAAGMILARHGTPDDDGDAAGPDTPDALAARARHQSLADVRDALWGEARSRVTAEPRARAIGHQPATIWLTGRHGAGADELAVELEHALVHQGCAAVIVDARAVDAFGQADGFAPDRPAAGVQDEDLGRAASACRMLNAAGVIAIARFISPAAEDRAAVREHIGEAGAFVEVYCEASDPQLDAHDPAGLHQRAREGKLSGVTVLTAPYEPPSAPAVRVSPRGTSVKLAADQVLAHLYATGVVPAAAR